MLYMIYKKNNWIFIFHDKLKEFHVASKVVSSDEVMTSQSVGDEAYINSKP